MYIKTCRNEINGAFIFNIFIVNRLYFYQKESFLLFVSGVAIVPVNVQTADDE